MRRRTSTIEEWSTLAAAAVEFVESRYDDPDLTLSVAAMKLNVSQRKLQRALDAEDTTWSALLLDTRMNAAVRLFKDRWIKVRAVSLRVGFRSYPHFVTTFHTRYGITPRKFQRARELQYLHEWRIYDRKKHSLPKTSAQYRYKMRRWREEQRELTKIVAKLNLPGHAALVSIKPPAFDYHDPEELVEIEYERRRSDWAYERYDQWDSWEPDPREYWD